MVKKILLVLAIMFPSLTVHAVEVNENLSVNGFVWFMYRSEITKNNDDYNKAGFDTDEAEMDIHWKLSDDWSSEIGFITGRWAKYYSGASDAHGPIVTMVKRANMTGQLGEGHSVTVGLQGTPWHKFMEVPWGYGWTNLYQIGIRDMGFTHRHDAGVAYYGKAGNLSYTVNALDGVGFANKDGIHWDDALVYTAGVGYDFMDDNGRAYFQYQYGEEAESPGAAGLTAGHSVASLGVFLKKLGPVDLMLEYHAASGDAEDGEGYASFFHRGGPTGSFDAQAYGVHVIGNVNDRLSFAFRYLGGNADFVDKVGGIQTGQHYLDLPGSASFKSRVTVGPLYKILPDGKLNTSLLYETTQLSDASKELPAFKTAGIEEAATLTWFFSSHF